MGDRFENTATTEVPSLTDFARTVNTSGGTRKALMSEVAKLIVESYDGSELGGENRTIQDAITDAKETASEAVEAEQTARQNADNAINADLAKKAYADGTYDNLRVGTSDQLMSSTYTIDEEPYLYRQTPSHAGTREIEQIVGGSVVWNQVAKYLVGTSTSNGITSTVKEDGTRTLQGTATALWSSDSPDSTHPDWANDVIYFCGCPKGGSAETFYVRNGYDARAVNFDTGYGNIVKGHANGFIYQIVVLSGTTIDATFTPQAFNLTKMFANNPAIADHIYNLEQATAGAGVEFFRKYFPEEYYAYDAGTMRSVEGLVSHDMVGFNQWDEEWEVGGYNGTTGAKTSATDRIRSKNAIKVLPNTTYCISGKTGGGAIIYYSESDAFIGNVNVSWNASGGATFTTPSDCGFIRFMSYANYGNTYKNDICINISYSAKNGQYEPYEKHSYPLDNSVTLRGIPQLVDGKIKWDGDVYDASGVVTKRYGIETYDGTENWTVTNNGTLYRAIMQKTDATSTVNLLGSYVFANATYQASYPDVWKAFINSNKALVIGIPDTITDATAWKNYLASHPLTLVYELATPTTEQAEPYQEVQICSPYGTEEYVTTGIVPVGHYTKYPTDLRSVIEQIADAPESDGTYTLKATVAGGKVTYGWEGANG